MNKLDLAKLLARKSHRWQAEAANAVDALVRRLLNELKSLKPSCKPIKQTTPRREPYLRARALLKLVDGYLRAGASIEIDGLGHFRLNRSDRVAFEPTGRVPVFIAYADEDSARVRRLAAALCKAGFEPWLYQEKLLPGQNWPSAIERAIDLCDFFVACFSKRSVSKRGHFQCELAYALEAAASVPLDEIYFIPVRLDDCALPAHIAKRVQHVDLYPDWEGGTGELIRALWHQTINKSKNAEPRA
jgi:nucleoid DNA-binding protein